MVFQMSAMVWQAAVISAFVRAPARAPLWVCPRGTSRYRMLALGRRSPIHECRFVHDLADHACVCESWVVACEF